MSLTTITSYNTTHSPFLRTLPLELRENVYRYLLIRRLTKFRYTKIEWQHDKRNTFFRTMLSLLLVSRQIHSEGMTVFLEGNQIMLYDCFKPPQPQMLKLKSTWLTDAPVPIRDLTLQGSGSPAIIASCPKLIYLTMEMDHHVDILEKARESGTHDAWIIQYKINLANLLGRRGSRLRLKAPGTFLEVFEIQGRGEEVAPEEVLLLIAKLNSRCRLASVWIERSAVLLPVEHAVEGWVVSIAYTLGDVMTAVLLRRVGEDDWALRGESGDEDFTDVDLWATVQGFSPHIKLDDEALADQHEVSNNDGGDEDEQARSTHGVSILGEDFDLSSGSLQADVPGISSRGGHHRGGVVN